MDSKIIEVLKQYKLTDAEIADMLAIAPMLAATSFQEFTANCRLLVKFGYPQSDLDFLFLANPNLFVVATQDLEADLKKLVSTCDDLEVALKENPFLI